MPWMGKDGAGLTREISFQLQNNPALIARTADFLSQALGLPGFPETAAGAAGAAVHEVASHWGQITGWIGSNF